MVMLNPPVSDDTEWEDMDFPPTAKPVYFWTVAVYLREQAYGGPEEGGWWYDTGERIDDAREFNQDGDAMLIDTVPVIFHDHDKACEYASIINDWLDRHTNATRPAYTSVLSNGRYYAEVHDGYPPAGYPDHRPHYE